MSEIRENILKTLIESPIDRVFAYLLVALSLCMPGLGYIFLTNRLFDYSLLITLFLCIYFSIPFFVLGLLYSSELLRRYGGKKYLSKNKEERISDLLTTSSLLSLFMFYFSLAVLYILRIFWFPNLWIGFVVYPLPYLSFFVDLLIWGYKDKLKVKKSSSKT